MKTPTKFAVVTVLLIAIVAPALAAKNWNSSKSNTSTMIGRTSTQAKYSYDFNWTVDSGRKILSRAELELLLEQVFAEIRADVLG